MSDVYCVEKFVTPSGSVHVRLVGQDDQWQQEGVPARDDGEDRDGRQRRPGQRQQDPPEEAERPAAVDRRGVLELDRDAPEERPQDDDRQRQRERRLGQGDPERVVEQAELSRTRMNSGRIATAAGNNSPSVKNVNSDLAAAEPRRANTNAASEANATRQDDGHRDQDAVADLPPEAGRRRGRRCSSW